MLIKHVWFTNFLFNATVVEVVVKVVVVVDVVVEVVVVESVVVVVVVDDVVDVVIEVDVVVDVVVTQTDDEFITVNVKQYSSDASRSLFTKHKTRVIRE